MKVGIIGSGGREHAICHSLKKSGKIKEIYCFPGNAGTAKIAKNITIDLENFNTLKKFILSEKIGLVIIGPEKPLVDGIVDFLQKNKIKVFGPNQMAAQLEGSKIFTKNLCKKYKIPTAEFGIFTDKETAFSFTENANYPLVIKADGLASGKGVYICKNKNEAKEGINEIFEGKFGSARNLLIEEFLVGEEMSYFIISDGKTIKNFGTAQDHKRVLEGDLGKNTGGMGAYSPSRLINNELEQKILNKIIMPTIKALGDLDTTYVGFLYVGLMIKNNDPYLIEYNVRMGDPECQVIMPRLKTDLVKILNASLENKLDTIKIKWSKNKCMGTVLCSRGYPNKYEINKFINLKKIKLNKKSFIFHAGTKMKNNSLVSNGGRVLNIVVLGKTFSTIRRKILNIIAKINWKYGFFRRDIGWRVIKFK